MNSMPISIAVLVISLLCNVQSQNKSTVLQNGSNYFHDDVLGIAFAKVGVMEKVENTTYRIMLQSSDNLPSHTAIAQVSASDRLFVDLPGSYGGKLFFDSSSPSELFQNRVLTDSVNIGEQNFRREYWIVYAGMGMWECVINCYTKEARMYYVVSLLQQMSAGKPGEEVNGKMLNAVELKRTILSSLQDAANVNINKFNTLLSSVQIHK